MSMITSCPTCGTMFRVVPDQLKISEGWVRCGHCSEVFDATANLSDESILEMPPLAEPTRAGFATRTAKVEPPAAPEETAPSEPPPSEPLPATRSKPDAEPKRDAEAKRDVEPGTEHEPAASNQSSESSSFFGAESQVLEPSPLDTPFVFRPSDLVRKSRDSELDSDLDLDVDSDMPPGEEREIPPEDLAHVSFVRKARRRSFWRRPGIRIALACASVLLAALLVLQLAYHDRDRLAFSEPALRPWLQAMCDAAGCTLGPPRQIEAIVIESSGFNRLREDTFRLAFTLRNSAAVPVAVPAMELTLTDADDQPIARRVITPQEAGAPGATIAAGGEWARSLGLVVSTPSSTRVAGYRLLAFYP